MKKIMKDAFALFAITLVAGVLLAAVYAITKEPIAQAELEARAAAYRTVFTDAAAFAADDSVDAAVKNAETELAAAGFTGVSVTDALYATGANGETLGCVMTVGGKGYGGVIQLTMGITADGKLSGISILSHSETAGLGAKCTEEAFYGQYAGKPAQQLTVVKNGATADNEIDTISGATVTSKAVTDAVNAGIWFAQKHMMNIKGGAAA